MAPDNASIASQDSVAQPADDVVAKPLVTTPAEEQPTSEPQPLLFADDRPEPYQPRGPPGLTFLPFFPAPLLLPADVVMPGELGVVVERVVRGNVVVAWAAISPVGWRVGRLAGPQAVGFRYYNPMTGRYISRDPIGYGDGMNVYLYVKGNPINRIDPLGLWEWLKDVILPALDVVVPVADFAYGLIDSVSMGLASETTTRTYGKETTDKITGSGGYKVAEVASYVDPRVATKKLGTALIKAGVDYVTDQVIEETLGEVDGLNEARMMAGARGGKPQLPGRAGGIGPVLKGQEGARKSKQEAEANGETVKGEEVTFELPSGKRTRSDLVTQTPDDQLKVREAKQGESAKLSPGQKEMKDTVNDGGTVIPRGQRAKDAGFVPGTPVRINNFEEDRF